MFFWKMAMETTLRDTIQIFNVDSESDEENTPDVIGNEEYDFLFGSDDIYSDFEGFDEEEILSTDPNFTPTKNRSQ